MSRLKAAAARARVAGAALAVALALASCGWFGGNQRPHAAFSYSLSSPFAPSVLTLDAAGSHDPDGEVVSYLWTVNGELHGGKVAVVPVTAAGGYQVMLTVTDDDGATDSATTYFSLDPSPLSSDFQITLLFSGTGMTEQRRQTFMAAAERWSEVITGDLSNVDVPQDRVSNCDPQGGFVTPGVVDDNLMLVAIRTIDGEGGILGQAGVCWRRSGTLGLPVVGRMTLDVDDVANLESQGRLFGVIMHEMGHLLDLNSNAWTRHGLLAHDGGSCSSSSEIHFIGANAASEWLVLGAVDPLPVEEDGGAGTMCSHWDEERLGSELMTGWASGAMELSTVTIGALDDLGYLVDYGAADPYTPPSALTEATLDAFEINEVLLPELGTIDPIDGTEPGDQR